VKIKSRHVCSDIIATERQSYVKLTGIKPVEPVCEPVIATIKENAQRRKDIAREHSLSILADALRSILTRDWVPPARRIFFKFEFDFFYITHRLPLC
jgi:hypothetical protein